MVKAHWTTAAMLTHLLHRPLGRREILAAKLHGPRCDTASMAFHRTMAERMRALVRAISRAYGQASSDIVTS